MAGIFNWMAAIPFDVLKTRLQIGWHDKITWNLFITLNWLLISSEIHLMQIILLHSLLLHHIDIDTILNNTSIHYIILTLTLYSRILLSITSYWHWLYTQQYFYPLPLTEQYSTYISKNLFLSSTHGTLTHFSTLLPTYSLQKNINIHPYLYEFPGNNPYYIYQQRNSSCLAPHGKYPNGIRSVFKELIAKEGFLALYKGTTPVLLRAFPANAVSYVMYLELNALYISHV